MILPSMMVVGLPGIDFATDLTLIVVRAWHAARQKEVEANRCYQERGTSARLVGTYLGTLR